MAPDIGTPESVRLTRRLMRHVVAIYFDFNLNEEHLQFVQTAFVFAVDGRWMLMTAGHCVTDIADIRRSGAKLHRSKLVDFMGEGATYQHPIPFDYDGASPMHIGVRENIDYGVLVPHVNTCQLLSANNVEPFDERMWDTEPSSVQNYFLLGFPAELNQLKGNQVNINASMFRLTRYAERPEDFPSEDPPIYFYGRVIEQPLGSLKGCSGGPIVALSPPNAEGQSTYHLVAMQVTTMGLDIKGMLMPPLGGLVRGLLARRADVESRGPHETQP
jgi:hypothetical protein